MEKHTSVNSNIIFTGDPDSGRQVAACSRHVCSRIFVYRRTGRNGAFCMNRSEKFSSGGYAGDWGVHYYRPRWRQLAFAGQLSHSC